MRAMIARPVPAVTTPTEPRPRGDRPVGIPPTPTHTGRLGIVGRTVRATTPADIKREDDNAGDDGHGYERDETDNRVRPVASSLGTPLPADPDRPPLPQREPGKTLTPDDVLRQLVGHLVAGGDQQAAAAGRHARRTLVEMAPGYSRQPVLRLTRPLTFRGGADDACVLCGRWNCKGDCYAPAPVGASCTGTGVA
ncbi:hypothetical protein [Streptomyces scopuliridis]|uniref:hypothetical protein n=1 Tax=Streptomyces scopuliridis TaxID=452529 RepID=UPI00368678C6